MGDVFEFIVDGVSGLAPGDVSGSVMVVGVCSAGEVGKSYLLGKSSDLSGLLGSGPLVDRLRDIFAAGGQNPVVVAVPCEGVVGGYITSVNHAGSGADAEVSGVPVLNAEVIVQVVAGGDFSAATLKISTDGGATFGEALQSQPDGQLTIPDTGTTLIFGSGNLVADDTYSFVVRPAIGKINHVGTGAEITVTGDVKAGADVVLQIVKSGERNEGTYQLSTDGDSFGMEKVIPLDGLIKVGDTGVTITFPVSAAVAGDTYSFTLLAPEPSVTSVMQAIEIPLNTFDVENVYVVGGTDYIDWAAFGVKADELFNKHRPTYFLCEARLPYDNETIDDWAAALIDDAAKYSYRFLSVCAAYGEISDSTGQRQRRNGAGLLQGRILSIPVMRSVGRVRDAAVSQLTLPEGWNESHVTMLANAGYVVAKHYAGLDGVYWEDGKTMADATSDFQFIRVIRTVFKALRLARIAALKSMNDEVGDPLRPEGAAGLAYLKANIENAVNTMSKAIPQELAGCVCNIPAGQDTVNNGVATELTLLGIPVIKQIKIFASYIYAGSASDPRLEV